MIILGYKIREEIKDHGKTKSLIDFSHWHRFLNSLPIAQEKNGELHIDDDRVVPFSIYQAWLRKFEGWSYGPLTPSHGAWKAAYRDIEIPFNHYYGISDED